MGEIERAVDHEAMLSAAREIMGEQTYCALITFGLGGFPQIRTMNPFPPDDDMVIWMATNSRCRKVEEMRANPHVSLYYADHKEATGSVVITGKAVLVDDMQEKLKRKRAYWSEAFPDWNYLLLIKVVPERIEVINYKRGLVNAPTDWRVPSIELTILPK